jgi:hypothetical protein
MGRKIFVLVLLSAALFALVIPLARADTISSSGPIPAGASATLTCPDGQTFESGTAIFYRQEGAKKPLATVALTPDSNGISGFATAPKGTRWYTATYTCEPITTQTLTGVGQATGAPVTVDCPPETPYLVAVVEVLALDPAIGQWLSTSYVTTETGVIIGALDPSFAWRATVTCSSAPQ